MRYLFRFGFESPEEFKANRAGGWDDESSEAIWINASSPEDALAWGRSIADQFVRQLFQMAAVEAPSWLAGGFAHWIESEAPALEWARTLSEILEADFGRMPDLEALAAFRSR